MRARRLRCAGQPAFARHPAALLAVHFTKATALATLQDCGREVLEASAD